MDDSNTDSDQQMNAGGSVPPSLQTLLDHIESLLPDSKESSVTTVVLYLDEKGEDRLIITGLRYPSGNIGQVRFDYRAQEGSSIIDLDLTTNTMQGYDMDQSPDSSAVSRHTLDIAKTSTWLDDLINRGSVEKI